MIQNLSIKSLQIIKKWFFFRNLQIRRINRAVTSSHPVQVEYFSQTRIWTRWPGTLLETISGEGKAGSQHTKLKTINWLQFKFLPRFRENIIIPKMYGVVQVISQNFVNLLIKIDWPVVFSRSKPTRKSWWRPRSRAARSNRWWAASWGTGWARPSGCSAPRWTRTSRTRWRPTSSKRRAKSSGRCAPPRTRTVKTLPWSGRCLPRSSAWSNRLVCATCKGRSYGGTDIFCCFCRNGAFPTGGMEPMRELWPEGWLDWEVSK